MSCGFQMMFETFKIPAFYMAVPSVMALYVSGRVTGLVLDCGNKLSHTVPVYEGNYLSIYTIYVTSSKSPKTSQLIYDLI